MTDEERAQGASGTPPEEGDPSAEAADAEPQAEASEDAAAPGGAADPDDPLHWATRAREFIDEATRIAREDLADKEITFEDTTRRAEELIRKQPLAAVGVAAGVGLLAGILINRRR